ncbi:hypothetical protein K0B04_02965 [Patescibacteria group bacterium]|nr:hypothetical protein [Patescibacteria group bacterium]
MDDTSRNIFKILKTKRRANEFLIFSGAVESLTHKVGGLDIELLIKESFGDNRPVWIDSVLEHIPGFKSGNVNEQDIELVKNIESIINKAKVVKVEMPFDPTDDFIDKVILTFEEYFNEGTEGEQNNIVIDIEVKEMSEPGALFFIEGKFIDLTLRNHLVSYLESKDVINRYL